MKNQTVVGIFNTAAEAQKAVQQLTTAGFERDYVDMSQAMPGTGSTNTAGTTSANSNQDNDDSIGGFFSSLFGSDNDEARTYADVARSGHSVVTVHVDTAEQAHRAADILDNAGALDVNSKAAEYGLANSYTNTRQDTNQNQNQNKATDGMTAEVIEEKLEVGKRTEQTGGVRLRSRIVEKPVEASVRLREEHVTVQRTPVNRPATEADFKAFKEGDVTLTESAERAVVAKEAHVVEEVSLGKNVTEREQTIHETVRNTEVDVEQIPGNASTSAASTNNTNQSGTPKQS